MTIFARHPAGPPAKSSRRPGLWPNRTLTRACGAILLAIGATVLHWVARLVTTAPHHQPSAIEMLLALATVITLSSGAAMLVIGPPLFQPCPWPPQDDARHDGDPARR